TQKAAEERPVLEIMATDEAGDEGVRKRARLILALLRGRTLADAAAEAGLSAGTARDKVRAFNGRGWKGLITVGAPRGGDFLARYDNGYWAERLVLACLDRSRECRAIPYGTSRSEPFTDMPTFREYMETQF